MNINKVAENFQKSIEIMQCPLCGEPFTISSNNSLVCTKGHCFDLSKRNYLNFLPNQKASKYHTTLFACRHEILAAGFYTPVLEKIHALINQFAKGNKLNIADIGCGEGFYSSGLETKTKATVWGIDIVKDAIILATKSNANVKWLVANLSNMPFKQSSIDVILNILTPANYDEFQRILTTEGILIKIIPGAHYLKEIRDCINQISPKSPYNNEPVLAQAQKHMNILYEEHLSYTLPLTPEDKDNFFQMTPLTFDIDLQQIDQGLLQTFNSITIDLQIIVCQKKFNYL